MAVNIPGPVGLLEGQLDCAAYPAHAGHAVVCHPHPQHGGTMQNKVVHTLIRAMTANALTALRFNFRGVGASEGAYGQGTGETDDTVAACDWLVSIDPGYPLLLAGFSFGAYTALRAANLVAPVALVTVAPPVRMFAFASQHRPRCPWLVVQGDADEITDIAAVQEWLAGMQDPPRLEVMSGASHFFHGRLPELRDRCRDFVRDSLDGAGRSG